jgi:hypothetical protein
MSVVMGSMTQLMRLCDKGGMQTRGGARLQAAQAIAGACAFAAGLLAL